MATDESKDQTYFLHRVSAKALSKVLFPLGDLRKAEVRKIAEEAGLVTATKKESMGICFVGQVGIREFLEQYISQQPGKIVDQNGAEVGRHDGAFFYTIGQRHGLDVGGGLPYYVAGKDMEKNEVYVTTDLQDERLWTNKIRLSNLHWINSSPSSSGLTRGSKLDSRWRGNDGLKVRIRHLAKLIPVKILNKSSNSQWAAELGEEVRALTPGQSAVFYVGNEVLGGGIVT